MYSVDFINNSIINLVFYFNNFQFVKMFFLGLNDYLFIPSN